MVYRVGDVGVLLFYVLFRGVYDSKYRFPLRVDGNVGALPVVMCVRGDRFVRVEFDFLSSDGGFRDVVILAMFNYVGGVWQDIRVCAGYYLLVVYTGKDGRVYLRVDL